MTVNNILSSLRNIYLKDLNHRISKKLNPKFYLTQTMQCDPTCDINTKLPTVQKDDAIGD